MTGDFSRLRFDRAKQYTAVIAQQGRVQLDSDANEQRAIDEYLRAIGLTDIIGTSGAPIHAPGFEITVAANGQAIAIGAGRFYVDGLMCEAGTAADYMRQPFLLRPTPVDQVRAVAAEGETMPPKSTYFFPKLLTGIVFNPLA